MALPSRRPRSMVRPSLRVATAVGGLMLTSVPLASAATLPAAAATPSAVSIASPGTGLPIIGGLVDSVVGIVTGAVAGISGAARAVSCSIAPAWPLIPARRARRVRR